MQARAADENALDGAVEAALDADQDEAFFVDVAVFEGPLHILLALARKQKVDLAHVSVLGLAEQYLAFVTSARARRLELAAEYLLMASWLAFLKSRLIGHRIMPERSEPEPAELEADQLKLRLMRLDAFRRAGEALTGADIVNRDVFLRGAPQAPVVVVKPEYSDTLLDLMAAFATHQNRQAMKRPHAVKKLPVMSLEAARSNLRERVVRSRDWRALAALLPRPAEVGDEVPVRSIHASFFNASLELTREGVVELKQDGLFSEIFVRKAQASAQETGHV